MQAHDDGHHPGGDFYLYQQAPGLLEDPPGSDRWVLGVVLPKRVKVLGVAEEMESELFELEELGVSGVLHRIYRLYWSHTQALLFIEGGPVQTLIGPSLLFVSGERSVAYDPRPHIENLVLAAVETAPKGVGLLQVFHALRQKYC